MELYLIRHAQSTNNALPLEVELQQRVCDPLLTEMGHAQAELLAEHLVAGSDGWQEAVSADPEAGSARGVARYQLTRLVCSPMRRTLLTARPIARALGLVPEIWLDIHEHGGIWLDHGEPIGRVGYPGITRAELETEFPGYRAPTELSAAGWWRDGFEDWPACVVRARKVAEMLRRVALATPDERIAMVSHGAFGSALIMALVGGPSDGSIHFSHNNTGISLIRFRPDGGIRLRYLNRVAHLPPEMIT